MTVFVEQPMALPRSAKYLTCSHIHSSRPLPMIHSTANICALRELERKSLLVENVDGIFP